MKYIAKSSKADISYRLLPLNSLLKFGVSHSFCVKFLLWIGTWSLGTIWPVFQKEISPLNFVIGWFEQKRKVGICASFEVRHHSTVFSRRQPKHAKTFLSGELIALCRCNLLRDIHPYMLCVTFLFFRCRNIEKEEIESLSKWKAD